MKKIIKHVDDHSVTLEICGTFTADALDEIVQTLGAIRAQISPAIQSAPDKEAPITDDPALSGGIRSDGRLMISLRSPAFGWQDFLLSNENTAAVGLHFRDTTPFWEKHQNVTVFTNKIGSA